jgi:hypothetical protein
MTIGRIQGKVLACVNVCALDSRVELSHINFVISFFIIGSRDASAMIILPTKNT